MRRRWCWALMMLPMMALPLIVDAATGAWSDSVSGPTLSVRGNWRMTPALQAPSSASGTITVVNWRYQLSRPAPSGLIVRLCAGQRCVEIEGGSGSTRSLATIAADETLHLAFGFQGQGALPPGLRVVSSQVTVNYQ
ncbi:flagellar protein FlhE [Pantoea rodasii]|uniref:Flagellar protein FlhE n=1 Tax=Pantoea rodasii TaxID=1076549 RepID=A0A2M9WFH7_9GAMM|nr:flagellar protein FlhE [Pantoea rodasii]ORM57570.1 flagellar protein FlhE [Pantoea rodasii]PJZ06218.1 flagellar protein FlhE [Pantoea rodasii]